ncbi:unnamed protein product [Porites lobata]|uniref:Uncharacterized protein n=1 Tax=Porites lobata TaxID=104759 RepID=A0ABN8NJF6_9CNID|nr:unnamed protein product [Porites lobata]
MDETPMRFELPATRTLEFTGNRPVPILSCGGDEQSFTVEPRSGFGRIFDLRLNTEDFSFKIPSVPI